ncbi:MAG: hypothetical protein MUO82_12050 [Candidatus Thermoplasmatota archaeon]|nr:hypothetical protein [Candidatus Thermoplasmatota archaeon]
MTKWELLSPELKVCSVIYEFTKIKKEKIWFSKIVKILDKDVSRSTISKGLDKLFDLGIIDGNWEKAERKWTRVFNIAGEANDFVKSIYENTKRGSIS